MDIAEAADANLASASGSLIERGLLPGGTVQRLGNAVVIDSGIPDDTYNLIVGASAMTAEHVDRVIAAVRQTGRPFAWWVAPLPQQEGLADLLTEAGLPVNEREPLMTATTAVNRLDHPDLEIRRADSRVAVADFAKIDAHLWDPPNQNVERFFELTAGALLEPDYPGALLVGYLNDRPVCCAELHYAAGVAGLYNVATLAAERRRGFARAIVHEALATAAEEGFDSAILQASPEGEPLYASLGFTELGRYAEFSVA